jgi:hypothetical protein
MSLKVSPRLAEIRTDFPVLSPEKQQGIALPNHHIFHFGNED